MFILGYIWGILKKILESIGLSVVVLIIVCIFTNIPNDLFKNLIVESKIEKADTIIVLGAGVTESGWPDRFSLERAVKGIVLYKKGYAPKIIFSGGWDHDGYIASADAMAMAAKDLGVLESAIIIEDKSKNTYENALNSIEIMKKNNMKNAILVTSESHMKRSLMIFNKLKVPVYPVFAEEELIKPEMSWKEKIHNFSILYQILYESLAMIKYKIKGLL